jgi:predicted Ser/Thr protein kinase
MTKATGPENESALLENREFSYRELKHITSNFSQEIGKGGFGAVYFGYLENGNPVAVKVHSDSSSQGVKEFLAEVKKKIGLKLYMWQFKYSCLLVWPSVSHF